MTGKSFGKRTDDRAAAPRPPAQDGGPQPLRMRTKQSDNPGSAMMVKVVAGLSFALVTVAVAKVYVAPALLGSGASATVAAARPVDLGADQIREIEERVLQSCAPASYKKLKGTVDEAMMQTTGDYWSPHPDRRDPKFHIKDGDRFMACAMNIQPERYCTRHFRRQLVAQLEMLVEKRRVAQQMLGAGPGKTMAQLDKSINGAGRGGIATGDWWTTFDSRFASGLRGLAESGYIQPSDFTGLISTMPKELEPYIVPATTKRCGQVGSG